MGDKFSILLKNSSLPFFPHKSVVDLIDDHYFDIPFFKENASTLSFFEYERCVNLYKNKINRIDNNLQVGSKIYNELLQRYHDVSKEIKEREFNHKKELQNIAEEIIREVYDVDEGLQFNSIIGDPKDFGFDSSFNQDSYNKLEISIDKDRIEYIKEIAKKRIIINSIAHGSSIHIWKSCYYLAKEQIEEIDYRLLQLYDEYTSIVSIMLWMNLDVENSKAINNNEAIVQGMSFIGDKVELEEDKFDDEFEDEFEEFLKNRDEDDVYGNAIAINFPVLLHELNKVVFESLSTHLIPNDLSEQEMLLYYELADSYEDEMFHYYVGPETWMEILKFMNENNFTIIDIFLFFEKIDHNEMSDFLCLLINDKKMALNKFEEYGK